MRRVVAAVVVGMLSLLTGCAGLPSSGPVQPGLLPRDAEDAQPFDLVPDPPQAGASPEQIVDGFLRAGVGAQDDWKTAREYLTTSYAQQWQPTSVTIDRLSERYASPATPMPTPLPTEPSTSTEITQRITAEAYVSEFGEYTTTGGTSVSLPFHLVQQDGQWRIDRANDGIVLHQDVFENVFRPASVMYFDPTYTYLVPDVRWFPANLITSRVTQALVDGAPSEWLSDAVRSAFPPNVALASKAVPLVDGGATAQVGLTPAAFTLDTRTLDRMQTQLEQSLESVGVPEVQLTVGTTPLDAEPVAYRTTFVGNSPLVELAGGEFGFLGADGESVEAVPGLTDALAKIDAASVVMAADRRTAAVQNGSGAVLRAYDDATFEVLDGSTVDLVPPSIDIGDSVWSASRSDPTTFTVYPLDGAAVSINALWPTASALTAFQISRAGSRVAALVEVGDRTEVWVAAIGRDDATGVPVGVGEPYVLASTPADGVDLAWVDDENLGVVLDSEQGSTVLEQPVGGRGTLLSVAQPVVDIAGGNSSVRLRTADGVLLLQRGQNWEEGASGVAVLGVQQGTPQ